MISTLYGKSGSNFEIVNKNGDFFLKKRSKNIASNSRLIIQAMKQVEFYKENRYPNVKTPEITDVFSGNSTDLSFVEMKYIFGKNATAFLRESDIAVINKLLENVLSYLDDIFKNAKAGDTNTVIQKAEQVGQMEFPRKEEIMKILSRAPTENLLVGPSHGDFTMANMVFTDSTIYAVDFLNTYVDSPILDLLSLRQDTHHLWSCLLSKTYACRPIETLKYIDNQLKVKYDWIIKSEWYKYLSLMNYVRMYPFNTDKDSTEFINNCILEYL